MKNLWPLLILLAGCATMSKQAKVSSVPEIISKPFEGPARLTNLTGDDAHTCNVVEVRGGVKPHYHSKSHELVYVIEGQGRLRLGDEMRSVSAGDVIFVARGTVHAFENRGEEPAVVLSVFTPGYRPGDRIFIEP